MGIRSLLHAAVQALEGFSRSAGVGPGSPVCHGSTGLGRRVVLMDVTGRAGSSAGRQGRGAWSRHHWALEERAVSRRSTVLAAAVLGALCLAGCGGQSSDGGAPTPSGTPSSAEGSASASAGADSASAGTDSASPGTEPAGSLPKVCPLLSKAEVSALTGEQVTLMTDDGGASGAARYCQWQLSQGQVTVAVTPETREGFDVRNKQAVAVPGVGATAYFLSGHLYVW